MKKQAVFVITLVFGPAGMAAAQPTMRAALQPASERRAAPEFALKDAAGKTVTLKKYRGIHGNAAEKTKIPVASNLQAICLTARTDN